MGKSVLVSRFIMRGTRNSRHRLALLLVALLGASCTSTSTGGGGRSSDPWMSSSEGASAPDWYAEPLSWAKLQHIESWLLGAGPERWPDEVPGAELELAQGRVDLARRERATLSDATVRARLSLAEAGFRRVLSDSRADAQDRRHADAGIGEVAALLDGPAPSVADVGAFKIRKRSAWGARPSIPSRVHRNTRPWRKITVHHSATSSAGLATGSATASAEAIRLIQKDHMETKGWGDIAYHFLIDPAGRVFQGRDIGYQGAHAGGNNNIANIGICLLGDFEHARPDPRAMRSLEELISALSARHGIARSEVHGHNDFRATECPGKNLMAWVQRYSHGSGL